jgi:hypothetical protein
MKLVQMVFVSMLNSIIWPRRVPRVRRSLRDPLGLGFGRIVFPCKTVRHRGANLQENDNIVHNFEEYDHFGRAFCAFPVIY